MISVAAVRQCATQTGVDFYLSMTLAGALQLPLGPGFQPLADIIDAHGVDPCRELLRRLIECDDAGRLLAIQPVIIPLGRMA